MDGCDDDDDVEPLVFSFPFFFFFLTLSVFGSFLFVGIFDPAKSNGSKYHEGMRREKGEKRKEKDGKMRTAE